jgi:hypothetical protein
MKSKLELVEESPDLVDFLISPHSSEHPPTPVMPSIHTPIADPIDLSKVKREKTDVKIKSEPDSDDDCLIVDSPPKIGVGARRKIIPTRDFGSYGAFKLRSPSLSPIGSPTTGLKTSFSSEDEIELTKEEMKKRLKTPGKKRAVDRMESPMETYSEKTTIDREKNLLETLHAILKKKKCSMKQIDKINDTLSRDNLVTVVPKHGDTDELNSFFEIMARVLRNDYVGDAASLRRQVMTYIAENISNFINVSYHVSIMYYIMPPTKNVI